MAMVTSVARGDLRMVASIYKPFSVKACGSTVECLSVLNRSKFSTSSSFSLIFNVITYPSGNLSGLFFKASLIRLVSTPYNSATSLSRITCLSRMTIILFSVFTMSSFCPISLKFDFGCKDNKNIWNANKYYEKHPLAAVRLRRGVWGG